MLILEIVVLVLACAGALYGIWSKTDLNKKIATLSTVITLAGVLAGIGLTVWKSIDAKERADLAEQRRQKESAEAEARRQREALIAEQKHQNDIRTLLAATDLTDIEVIWSFARVPADVLSVLKAGELIDDTHLLSNEDIDRLPQQVRSLAINAWHLDSTVIPLIAVIQNGKFDFKVLYNGEEIQSASNRFENDHGAWVDGVGTDLGYIGPTNEIIFPLNSQMNAALSLGKKTDDPIQNEPTFGWQQDIPYLFNLTNYGFHAHAERVDAGFQISWTYHSASLARAVERRENAKLTAGFASEFSFLIVRQPIPRVDYLTKAAQKFRAQPAATGDVHAGWDRTSTLEIYINGLKTPHYTFDVTRAETDSHTTDLGTESDPQHDFEYTRFYCKLRRLD
jgi:hypothetical protein